MKAHLKGFHSEDNIVISVVIGGREKIKHIPGCTDVRSSKDKRYVRGLADARNVTSVNPHSFFQCLVKTGLTG